MNIFSKAIVSNSDIIKNYKTCREKAKKFGKIFIMKNNQPDAVLFSISEYDRISELIEYLESFNEEEVSSIMNSLPKSGLRKNYTIENLRGDLKLNMESDPNKNPNQVLTD